MAKTVKVLELLVSPVLVVEDENGNVDRLPPVQAIAVPRREWAQFTRKRLPEIVARLQEQVNQRPRSRKKTTAGRKTGRGRTRG